MDPFCPNEEDKLTSQQSPQHQLATLLEDFNEFEETFLPPYSVDDMNLDLIDWDFTEEAQDTEIIVEGNIEEEGQIVVEEKAYATQTVEVMSYGSHGVHGGGVGGGRRGVVGGFVNYGSTVGSSSGMNAWRQVAGNLILYKAPRRKSKCKNSAEAALKLEQMKIKNRVSAAQSIAKKQAHIRQLQLLIQGLYKENAFLKKLLPFMEGTLKIDMTRKQLKRTFSGPI